MIAVLVVAGVIVALLLALGRKTQEWEGMTQVVVVVALIALLIAALMRVSQ